MAINIARRKFVAALGSAAFGWPLAARAQQGDNVTKIGVLWPGASPPASPRMGSFRKGLSQLGYVEGRNVAIELRYAQGGPQQLRDLAAELVRLKVDVITTFGDLAPRIVQQATGTIPIIAIGDESLVRTDRQSFAPRREYYRDHYPFPGTQRKATRIAATDGPRNVARSRLLGSTTGSSQAAMSENAARSLKLKLRIVEVQHRDDVVGAFRAARDSQAEALNVFSSPILASLYREIIDGAAEYGLPAIYQWKEDAEAGGLMSYGPSLPAMYEQAASHRGQGSQGAKPADLPVEQPTKFELVVNLKTAKHSASPCRRTCSPPPTR